MDLWLVRHAIAEDVGPDQDDAGRRLTEKGIRKFQEAARGLAVLGVTLDRIYASPWTRARETAVLLHDALGGELEVHDGLAAPPDRRLLHDLRGARIALVGHEPWMGMLASLLVLGSTERGDQFPFKKGGVMALTGVAKPAGCALLEAYPPRVLRRVVP